MHSIEFDKSIIKGVKLINVEKIITHEEIIEQKADKLIKYIESFNYDDIIISSKFGMLGSVDANTGK